MSALSRELLELQQSQAEFGAALEAVGTRGELLEVKRRLEGHQVGVVCGGGGERVKVCGVTELLLLLLMFS
jgi:hypothetical protein